MQFTDAEIAYLNEMRALTTAGDGELLFVGLTPAESREFHTLTKRRGGDSLEEGDRYLELHEKHEKARIGVVTAEVDLRNQKPTRH